MGDKIKLALDKRELHGKKVTKLRNEGLIPAVVYGPGIDPVSVQIEAGLMLKTYNRAGTYTPINLEVDAKKMIVMIKDIDRDPVRGTIRHVSFHAVNAKNLVNAEVPIHLVGEGESEAERNGLIVLQNLEKIEVRALPMDLPESIEISIVDLKEAGEKLTLGDAKLPEGVEYVEHESHHGDEEEGERRHVTDLMVASVWEPAALQAQNEAAAGDAEDETSVESDNGEAEEIVNDGEDKEEEKSE